MRCWWVGGQCAVLAVARDNARRRVGAAMSDAWHMVISSLGRRRRRWSRGFVRTVTAVPALIGFGLLATGAAEHGGVSGLLMSASLPCFLGALGWRVWRAPEHDLPEPLRLRRRSRRVGLRVVSLLLLSSALGLVASSYWLWRAGEPGLSTGQIERARQLAHSVGTVALWLLAAAPVPFLLESALWGLAPGAARHAVRMGRNAEEVQRANRFRGKDDLLRFDPDLGAHGLPVPAYAAAPAPLPGRPYLITARRLLMPRLAVDEGYSPAQERWLHSAVISWTGRELIITDGRGRQTRVNVYGKMPPRRRRVPFTAARRETVTDRASGLVWIQEMDLSTRLSECQLLLLDQAGRRLLTMPGQGFAERDVRALAAAAGLDYGLHRMIGSGWDLEIPLTWRLFPRRWGHLRIRIR